MIYLSMELTIMTNVLVTGSQGQLGAEIELLSSGYAYNNYQLYK